MRIGLGYDSHRFADGRRLVLGGVDIPYDRGLLGHSDADVLCHAIIDAIIGALGLGDIGAHFPDTDPEWKNAVSLDLLRQVVSLAQTDGYSISWIDATIITEQPKIAPHISSMKSAISGTGIGIDRINIKAKTNEGMGFIGRSEGIAAMATCLLQKKD